MLAACGQVALVVLFGGAGTAKLAVPCNRFVDLPFQDWAEDFGPGQVRAIGALEAMTAAGCAFSLLASIDVLSVASAAVMAVILVGAMATHLRRREFPNMMGNALWITAAVVVIAGRAGP